MTLKIVNFTNKIKQTQIGPMIT